MPLNFLAVRLAQAYTHPRVFATADGGLPAKMQLRVLPLARSAWRCCTSRCGATRWPRRTPAAQLRALRRKLAGDDAVAARRPHRGAEPPDDVILAQPTNALPDNTGYVAAAYLVFLALVLIYVVIMASKLARFERELTELNELADERRDERPGALAGAEPEEAAHR